MVTGGLCRTDFGEPSTIGGLAMEYFNLCSKIEPSGPWYHQPHVFQKAMAQWTAKAGMEILAGEKLVKVEKTGARITSVSTASGKVFSAPVFIDASYEGDLMAAAKVSYLVGREPKDQYGEKYAGIQQAEAATALDRKDLEDDCPCLGGKAEHYIHGTKMQIPALKAEGKPRTGLSKVYPLAGSGDRRTQAYCFRLTVTRSPENRVPFPKPANYNPERYEILMGILEKYPTIRFSRLVHFGNLPNKKFDMNSSGLQSIDFIGGNVDYPDGDNATRERIRQDHIDYQQGFLWFLGNDPRVPQSLREQVNAWGLCKDEFVDNGHWPYQLYVREARRMLGAYVMTEKDLLAETTKEDAVGLGCFLLDSHHTQYLVNPKGMIESEGTLAGNKGGVRPGKYQIPYRVLLPKAKQCDNLIVPVCLSASHVAYTSLRMEPVYMILGHAAGVAAVMAKENGTAVQQVNIKELQRRLLEQKQILQASQ